MVVLSHSFTLMLPLSKIPYGIGWIIGKMIAITIPFGLLGVELFFVLSGYLVGSILLKEFMRHTDFTLKEVKGFWIRRWFRTLPNYYLILILNILFQYYWYGKNRFDWHYFIFTQNLFTGLPKFFGESWSLTVEEWFYITMPLVIFACSLLFKNIPKRKILLNAIGGYILLFVLLKILYACTYDYHGETAGAFIIKQARRLRGIASLRLDAIGFGVVMAYLNYFKKEQLLRIRKKLFAIGLIGAGTVTLLHYLGTYPGLELYQYKTAQFLSNAFLCTALPVFFSCLLPFAATINTIGSKSIEKAIVYISTISYSIYLVHLSLIYNPFFDNLKTNSLLTAVIYCLLYFLVVLIVSSFLYFLYERPMTKLRDKF
jgi:peptidoglycan/LPS O-acetylase OafA/YrhL